MNTNEKLEKLYTDMDIVNKINKFNQQVEDENDSAAYPLLLKSYDEYENADIKVMIFGKETNGWDTGNENGHETKDLMNLYEGFFNKGNINYFGQFRNMVMKIIRMAQEEMKDKDVRYLWNNLVKAGNGDKGFPWKLYDDVLKNDLNKTVPAEIEILQPDFIIFFTGPNSSNGPYDDVLNEIFNNPPRKKVAGFDENELCEIVLPNVKKAYRLYHPVKLQFNNKVRKYTDYFEAIISGIRSFS